MSRILLRAGKSPLEALSHEQSLATTAVGAFGSNSGNLLFLGAVHRHLSTLSTEVVPDGYRFERRKTSDAQVHEINENYNHYVLPMADSFRPTFAPHLRRLANVISKLTIPVTVVGVGARLLENASSSEIPSEVREATKSFVSAVLDHSTSIGVRGEKTADVLRGLGFDANSIDVIGCPSLFTDGQPEMMKAKRRELSDDARVALNFTPNVDGIAEFLDVNTLRYGNSIVVPQHSRELATMLWGDPPPSQADERLPVHADHRLYEEDRLRFFVDAKTWIDYLASFDFVVGTRLHGTIAGILAKTPSLLLTHDSRTAELAAYHGIPHKRFSDCPRGVDVQHLYEELDAHPFEQRRERTFNSYVDFLNRNGLANIFQPGNENADYDKYLANTDFPGPVHTLMRDGSLGRRQFIERISWLRQSHEGDRSRPVYAYEPPVAVRSRRLDAPEMADRTDALRREIRSVKQTLSNQDAELREQGKRLANRKALLQSFEASVIERKARKFLLRVEGRAGSWRRRFRNRSHRTEGH